MIYPLTSILDRIELARLFSKPQPLEVELGSGDGSFLAEYAARHPERNFIGVERLLGRLRKLDRKGRRAGLANLRGVRIESAYFLEYTPAAALGLRAACLFSRSLAQTQTPPPPPCQRAVSGAGRPGPRAGRHGLFAYR